MFCASLHSCNTFQTEKKGFNDLWTHLIRHQGQIKIPLTLQIKPEPSCFYSVIIICSRTGKETEKVRGGETKVPPIKSGLIVINYYKIDHA